MLFFLFKPENLAFSARFRRKTSTRGLLGYIYQDR